MNALNDSLGGVLIIDKPATWTSHDVVAKVRGLTRVRQVGHSGTLDPMATGVLVLCLGKATRLLEYLVGVPKSYRARITLGATTDTYDADGEVTATGAVPPLSAADVEAALAPFRGPIQQIPPAYSAIKQDGVALYKRARRGEAVEVAARPVTIYELTLIALELPALELYVKCSAGTYIRSLAHDLGQALGCGAHLSGLRREAVGPFTLAQAVSLETLAEAAQADRWTELLLPADVAVAHLSKIVLPQAEAARLLHGQGFPAELAGDAVEPAAVYDQADNLLAIAAWQPDRHRWQPVKVLASPA